MTEIKVLLIGGSAGSIPVILQILPDIRPDIDFPIIIILHRKAYPKSYLHHLFNTTTTLEVIEIDDKAALESGKIYLVPADYHLLFEDTQYIALDASEKVNYSRPSIDVTFESAARVFRHTVAAILLSGGSQDGVEGLINIIQHKGNVAIQDPLSADVSYMPQRALEKIPQISQLLPEQMASFINRLKT